MQNPVPCPNTTSFPQSPSTTLGTPQYIAFSIRLSRLHDLTLSSDEEIQSSKDHGEIRDVLDRYRREGFELAGIGIELVIKTPYEYRQRVEFGGERPSRSASEHVEDGTPKVKKSWKNQERKLARIEAGQGFAGGASSFTGKSEVAREKRVVETREEDMGQIRKDLELLWQQVDELKEEVQRCKLGR